MINLYMLVIALCFLLNLIASSLGSFKIGKKYIAEWHLHKTICYELSLLCISVEFPACIWYLGNWSGTKYESKPIGTWLTSWLYKSVVCAVCGKSFLESKEVAIWGCPVFMLKKPIAPYWGSVFLENIWFVPMYAALWFEEMYGLVNAYIILLEHPPLWQLELGKG